MKQITLLLLLITCGVQAQSKEKTEKIKAYKTAYFTEQLALTPQEAEKFWPVFNLFSEEMRTLKRRERKELMNEVVTLGNSITDAQANVLIDKKIDFSRKRLALEEKLVRDLGAFFSAKKILLVFKAEEDFRRKLLERYRGGKKK